MTVLPARGGDLDALVALEASFASARWSDQVWADELEAAASDPSGRCVLVARADDGAIVGAVTFSHVAGVADLNRVVVDPAARRKGLGRRLVLEGLMWAQSVGAQQVILEVEADNGAALALYEQVGFVALATRSHYYGPGQDARVMALRIGEDA